ncbi:MAG: cellulase family glycosylhydrolase [Planctomycetota bacterium]|jgi:hypothetical protein
MAVKKVLLRWAAGCLLIGFCQSPARSDDMPFIEVDPHNLTAFRQRNTSKPFVAVGVNYFDHQTGWAPKLWQRFDQKRVRHHLTLIRSQGFNTIRVFLTLESFHRKPGQVQPEGEEKFRKLLAMCRNLGIYVIPSGPDHWEGRPSWRGKNAYADESVLRADEKWWQEFAAKFRDEPAILAWDLKNEPHIPWSDTAHMSAKWNQWLQQQYSSTEEIAHTWQLNPEQVGQLGKIEIPTDKPALNHPRLYDYQRFREYLADRWTQRMVAAIRRSDPNHMVTIGHIQYAIPVDLPSPKVYAGFNVKANARYLDFVTIHFYPLARPKPCDSPQGMAANTLYLETLLYLCSAGKPVMLGEFGWYGGGDIRRKDKVTLPEMPVQHQDEWCNLLLKVTRGRLCGWLNWAFADTPTSQDLTRFSGCWDEHLKLKPWGKSFNRFACRISVTPQPLRSFPQYLTSFSFDRKAMLTSHHTGREYLRILMEKRKK